MITIPLFLVAAISCSLLAWFLLTLFIAVVFMLGDDKAFVIAPIISAFCVLFFWLVYSGVVVFK